MSEILKDANEIVNQEEKKSRKEEALSILTINLAMTGILMSLNSPKNKDDIKSKMTEFGNIAIKGFEEEKYIVDQVKFQSAFVKAFAIFSLLLMISSKSDDGSMRENEIKVIFEEVFWNKCVFE